MKFLGFTLIVVSALILSTGAARADEAASQSAGLPMLYVGKFQPLGQSPRAFGPLHALNSDIHRLKAARNAERLSSALIEALRKREARVEMLPADAALRPHSGWLLQGVYYALDENNHLISVPLLSTHNGPNVEVSVTVADLARNPDVPFAVIGTDAVLKGQGTAISWNPYIAAAKFVFHEVQGQDSITILADQIAQKFLDEHQELLGHDPVKQDGTSSR